jgi:rhodanese-related sulfurtransferase
LKQVSPSELKQWIENDKDFLLIDLREDWERELYHIGGLHLPLGDLIKRIAEIPKGKPVVLYCEKGIRSVIAIQRLEAGSFDNLYNLAGGMAAWKKTINLSH